jgi:DNA modification methylase
MPKPIPYRLYNEDCFKTFERLAPGSIDMVMVDPPYGTTACKWDTIIPLEPMWKALRRVVKPNGAMVFTASQPFTSVLVCSNLKMFRYCWTWEKTKASGHLNAKKQPLMATEDVPVFYRARCLYTPQGTVSTYRVQTKHKPDFRLGDEAYGDQYKSTVQLVGNYPRSLITFQKPHKPLHPTQKPVALMEYLIKTYTNEGETVLDFAMGSGTTGVACMNLGRRFIGCDNDVEHGYFEIARRRITEAWQACQERSRMNA